VSLSELGGPLTPLATRLGLPAWNRYPIKKIAD